jgi:D-alanyl-D-alanine carboxypeptidase
MKKNIMGVVAVTLAVAMALPAAGQSKLAENPEVRSRLQMLEAYVESQMAYRGQPGVAIGIVYDQELVYARGFGYADVGKKTPVTPQTLFRICSITKTFTATALMQLRDEGRLQLDDPVTKHLPWYRVRAREEGWREVTLRHLLTHTSGLPREADFPYWSTDEFPTREQVIERLPGQEGIFRPETRWKYSNLALTLAGEVVAAVSGMAYEDYVQKNILEPLGMEDTCVALDERARREVATGYGRRLPDLSRSVRPNVDTRGITPAANMSSNVADLARYASLQFRKGARGEAQVLKGASLEEMHRVHWLNPDWRSGWGLGFSVLKTEQRSLVGHGGWCPGQRTALQFSPEEKLAVIVLTNADDGEPGMYATQVWRLVAPALKNAAPKPPKPAAPGREAAVYAGLYRAPWGDTRVMLLDSALVMFSPSFLEDPERVMRLAPEGEHRFRVAGGHWDGGSDGEVVRFEMGPDGKAQRLHLGTTYSDRVP